MTGKRRGAPRIAALGSGGDFHAVPTSRKGRPMLGTLVRRSHASLALAAVAALAGLVVRTPAAFAAPAPEPPRLLVIEPEQVWDGVAAAPEKGWIVVVRGARIEAAGPARTTAVPAGAEHVALPGATLLPGLIEGHSHLFLHPYDETLW